MHNVSDSPFTGATEAFRGTSSLRSLRLFTNTPKRCYGESVWSYLQKLISELLDNPKHRMHQCRHVTVSLVVLAMDHLRVEKITLSAQHF